MRRRPVHSSVGGWPITWTVLAVLTSAGPSVAAPILRSAVVEIRFLSPVLCQVALTSVVEGAATIEHRIEVAPDVQVELVNLRGGVLERPVGDVGRTRAAVVRPAAGEYTLDYRVALPPKQAHRCPLWLPAVPADGRSRNVRIDVVIPEGATPAGTMPAFAWTGVQGTTAIAHLPSFVLLTFAMPGAARPWDVSRVMDVVALATLALASLAWMHRARSRRSSPSHQAGAET